MKPSLATENAPPAGEAPRSTLYTQRTAWRAPKACDYCKAEFRPKRRGQRFCCQRCRFDHHNDAKAATETGKRLIELEREIADLKEQVALIRGHLVL